MQFCEVPSAGATQRNSGFTASIRSLGVLVSEPDVEAGSAGKSREVRCFGESQSDRQNVCNYKILNGLMSCLSEARVGIEPTKKGFADLGLPRDEPNNCNHLQRAIVNLGPIRVQSTPRMTIFWRVQGPMGSPNATQSDDMVATSSLTFAVSATG